MDSETLRQRKEMLLARSSLYRLALARDGLALRESLTMRNLVSSVATSTPWRPLALGALMLVAGRSRLGGVIGIASRVLGLARVFRGRKAR
jgi:hypothetical protein